MSLHTSFRIGGPADLYICPADLRGLESAIETLRDEGVPSFILGGGANLLVGDKGIRGAVLDIGRLRGLEHLEDGMLVQAGCPVDLACEQALAWGLSGLQDFYGMPGSVGGAIFMNARCYEREFSQLVREVTVLGPGETRKLSIQDLGPWSYKRSPFQQGAAFEGFVILSALLALDSGSGDRIGRAMLARRADRVSKGHYEYPSAGSIFKNDRNFGRPTGAILDELGFKGRRIGDAAVSPRHANIFVNLGSATAADMKRLVQAAQEEAERAFGFCLEPEVLFVGEF
ncbi:MAG TPA: UDP-N-acetylmuramate dehydrogenase [Rectinemataceae bacterium]